MWKNTSFGIEIIELDRNTTQQLFEISRKHNVTLTSTIYVAFVKARIGAIEPYDSRSAAISRSSGVGSPLMFWRRLVEAPRFLSSRSNLSMQTVMLMRAFFKVTMLRRISSSVHDDIFRGTQHLKEIFRSFSSPTFNGFCTSRH